MIESQDIITQRHDRSQIIQYNNPLFQCYAVNPFFPKDKSFYVTEHWHEDLEYLYVIDGELEYTVNGEKNILHAGEGSRSGSAGSPHRYNGYSVKPALP